MSQTLRHGKRPWIVRLKAELQNPQTSVRTVYRNELRARTLGPSPRHWTISSLLCHLRQHEERRPVRRPHLCWFSPLLNCTSSRAQPRSFSSIITQRVIPLRARRTSSSPDVLPSAPRPRSDTRQSRGRLERAVFPSIRAGPVGHLPAPCSLRLRADAGARGRHPRTGVL